MLQQVLRNHPNFWSLPSESDIIWDRFCHPALNDWTSEALDEGILSPADRQEIINLFEDYMRPATYWRPFEKANLIWGFRRVPAIRKMMRLIFERTLPLTSRFSKGSEKRLLEKTASNCFRLGYVFDVFPDAKIIYPVRDGRNNVNSLINAWRDPTRFFTYEVPQELHIPDCDHQRWKFVLPPGWRDYVRRPLADICAFQWRSCHEFMLSETQKEKYRGRVLRFKLEEFAADPDRQVKMLANFLELPYDDYFKSVAANLPIVNSADSDVSVSKWQGPNREQIESVMSTIAPIMKRLGYEVE